VKLTEKDVINIAKDRVWSREKFKFLVPLVICLFACLIIGVLTSSGWVVAPVILGGFYYGYMFIRIGRIEKKEIAELLEEWKRDQI
jgi:hypothetical protein